MAAVKRSYREAGFASEPTYLASSQRTTPVASRDSSRQQSPLPAVKETLSRSATFASGSSIILIGVRGVGKSTLGVLATTAYNRQLIDLDRVFGKVAGSSRASYRKTYGNKEYLQKHDQILAATLKTHGTGAVLVCSFADLEGNGSFQISEYAQTHPVVHITRDLDGVRKYLKVWPAERISQLLTASGPLLRSCSNFEFFNLSENLCEARESSTSERNGKESEAPQPDQGGFLTLKRVERDFLRLLRNIIGDHGRAQEHHSAYPLSDVGVEHRPYTFAVQIPVSNILKGPGDHDAMQIGADAVELVVDTDNITESERFASVSQAFAIVRRATVLPILLSVGDASGRLTNESKIELTEHCLRLGPELCVCDLAIREPRMQHQIDSKGNCKIIGALELRDRPAQGWSEKRLIDDFVGATIVGCDIVKITMPAEGVDDAFEVHAFRRAVKALKLTLRLIAYSTGRKGLLSRCFNQTLTPVDSPKAFMPLDNGVYHGDVRTTAGSITDSLFAMNVFDPLRYFIYGGDVSYSISPALHNTANAALGLRYTCEKRSSESLDDLNTLIRHVDFGGSAIAQPYKTKVTTLLDRLSLHAKIIGAVNTVVPCRELTSSGDLIDAEVLATQHPQRGSVKALYGFNTDWVGIRACLRRGLSPANAVRHHSTAMVCGAGGMARAAVYSLLSLGVRHIFVCNRTKQNALALAEHYNKLIDNGEIFELTANHAVRSTVSVLDSLTVDWPAGQRAPTMVVCCVPTHTIDGQATLFSLPEAWLHSPNGGVVVDVAYGYPVSPVARQIKERAHQGWVLMDGFDFLPEQAYSQFELFTGRRAPRQLMKDEMSKQYHAREGS